MEISGRLWVGWGRVLIGGMCLAVLCAASGRLAAQTSGQQVTAQLTSAQQAAAQQGIEVAAAKAGALELPDAPLPAAEPGLALEDGESLSAAVHCRLTCRTSRRPLGHRSATLG